MRNGPSAFDTWSVNDAVTTLEVAEGKPCHGGENLGKGFCQLLMFRGRAV